MPCFRKSGTNLYEVIMDDAAILAGPYGLPVEIESKFNLELLYVLLFLSHFLFHSFPRSSSPDFLHYLRFVYEFTTMMYMLLNSLYFPDMLITS